jgi:Protein of unknown function (DUF1214)
VDGANKYVIHFEKEELPPVEASWSITMYHKDGFPIANPINRFAIGDRDDLKFNSDGSLDIYIQRASPGAEKEANWLPLGRRATRDHDAALCAKTHRPRTTMGSAPRPACILITESLHLFTLGQRR